MLIHKSLHKILVTLTVLFLAFVVCKSSMYTIAVEKVKGVVQTDATANTATVKWNAINAKNVQYSVYTSVTKKDWMLRSVTKDTHLTMSGLGTGCKLYLKVVAQVGEETGADSSIIQIVTAPTRVKNVRQIDAGKGKVTFAWDALDDVDRYFIFDAYTQPVVLDNPSNNKTTIAGLADNEIYDFYVAGVIISENGFVAVGQTIFNGTSHVRTKTLPGKLKSSEYKRSYENGKWNLTVSTKVPVNTDGTQIRFYYAKGKKVISTFSQSATMNTFKYKNKFICYRGRAYMSYGNVIYYGPWTSYRYFANMKITAKCKKGVTKVRWKKVQGAKRYLVYVSKKHNAGYRYAGSVVKNAIDIRNYAGLKFSKKQKCYIKIIPQVYEGGKYKSSEIESYGQVTYFP